MAARGPRLPGAIAASSAAAPAGWPYAAERSAHRAACRCSSSAARRKSPGIGDWASNAAMAAANRANLRAASRSTRVRNAHPSTLTLGERRLSVTGRRGTTRGRPHHRAAHHEHLEELPEDHRVHSGRERRKISRDSRERTRTQAGGWVAAAAERARLLKNRYAGRPVSKSPRPRAASVGDDA